MIGGRDIVIPTDLGALTLQRAVREVSRAWPRAIVEDAVTGQVLSQDEMDSLREEGELLVYKDDDAARQWAEFGANEPLHGTLIHLIHHDGHLTVVVDVPPSAEMEELVEHLTRAVGTGTARQRSAG